MTLIADHVNPYHGPTADDLHVVPVHRTTTVRLPAHRQQAQQGGHEDYHFRGINVTVACRFIYEPHFRLKIKTINIGGNLC